MQFFVRHFKIWSISIIYYNNIVFFLEYKIYIRRIIFLLINSENKIGDEGAKGLGDGLQKLT